MANERLPNNFYRGLMFALPISLLLWAVIIAAVCTAVLA